MIKCLASWHWRSWVSKLPDPPDHRHYLLSMLWDLRAWTSFHLSPCDINKVFHIFLSHYHVTMEGSRYFFFLVLTNNLSCPTSFWNFHNIKAKIKPFTRTFRKFFGLRSNFLLTSDWGKKNVITERVHFTPFCMCFIQIWGIVPFKIYRWQLLV